MRFQHLIWDFDGTLFDTYPALIRAIGQALLDEGITVAHERIAHLLSDTLDATIATLVAENGLDQAEFEARITHYHRQIPLKERPPFPGVIRVCERVVAAGGQNFIFTHRGRESLMQLLEAHGITDLFADCMTVDDGYPRKPDPAGFVALIEKHALPRAAVLAIGDRDLDILAGQGAGVQTCLFGAQPSTGAQPDYVIAAFTELETILGLDE